MGCTNVHPIFCICRNCLYVRRRFESKDGYHQKGVDKTHHEYVIAIEMVLYINLITCFFIVCSVLLCFLIYGVMMYALSSISILLIYSGNGFPDSSFKN